MALYATDIEQSISFGLFAIGTLHAEDGLHTGGTGRCINYVAPSLGSDERWVSFEEE
jgi:hypothetical protein